MEDGSTNAMNLNLNLGLIDDSSNDTESEFGSLTHEAIRPGHWLEEPNRIADSLSLRSRQRRRPPWRPLWRQLEVSPIARVDEEGSIGEEHEEEEETKTHDKNVFLTDESLGKEGCEEKRNDDAGSFFDCNVCLDLANDPVVTCCGHLFCWICIYKWLHFHSDAKECPVCKGEVSLKNITPIYGRGDSVKTQPIDDINLKIPNRPQAQRVESWRQVMHRSDFDVHMEEVVFRRLINRRSFRSRAQDVDDDARQESSERSNFVLNQFQTHRPIPRERNHEETETPHAHNAFDHLSQRNSEPGESSQIPSSYYQRLNSNLAVVLSNLAALHSADQVLDPYLPNHNPNRAAVDDRNSMSSIAAVIESESRTFDRLIENDPTVLLSTSSSSSRRRNNSSRVSDVSSGDSRTPRRRRLN